MFVQEVAVDFAGTFARVLFSLSGVRLPGRREGYGN